MQQTILDSPGTVHFTDEQHFRLTLPDMAAVVDSQLPRRALTVANCTFECAYKGRLRNSLGQVCTFQAKFRLKDNPEAVALIELVEVWDKVGRAQGEKTTFRYDRETA